MLFLDFFAGVGGFRRGLEMAGHKCIGFCEWDKYATASYTSMHLITDNQRERLSKLDIRKRQKEILKEEYRNGEWYSSDIRNVDARSVPRADCWCFGAPCQDFSVAGKRAGLEGDRSSLIREIFRILGEMPEAEKPEWLLYENVKGMFSSNKGFDYLEILLAMDELGYDIEWQLFNSKDWGVPQNRERVYTVGHLRRCGERKILPITRTDGENSVQLTTKVIGGIGEINFGKQWRQENRVYDSRTIDTALEAHPVGNTGGNSNLYSIPIEIIGHRDGYRRNMQTFSTDGITESIDTGQGGGRGPHVGLKIINKEIKHMHEAIHDVDGLASTLLARDYKDAQRVAIPVLTPDRHGVGLQVCGILRTVRSDYGKEIRKQYEAGELDISRHDFLEYDIRTDGITNTIDSVQKDNYLALEPIASIYPFNSDSFGRKMTMGCSKTLKAEKHDTSVVLMVKEATKQGYAECEIEKDSVNLSVPGSNTRRGRVGREVANTLDCGCNQGIFVQVSDNLTVYAIWYPKYECYIAIRKLTPKECFRLQGWTDEYFEKAVFVNFDSQLYKQAGNGVTVNVVYEIGSKIPC